MENDIGNKHTSVSGVRLFRQTELDSMMGRGMREK